MATLKSYDLKGQKLSFANWISNLSPTDTPFVSMTGKEATNQTKFYWQTDRLDAVKVHNIQEGSDAVLDERKSTEVKDNVTQILRRVVKVSDTANTLANYGRGRELQYQMEKMGKAIKRDLEAILLSDQAKQEQTTGSANTPRKTAGFAALVAPKDQADTDTGAVVNFETAANKLAITDLQKMTYNLYLANSKADVIMFHPKHSVFFSYLTEVDGYTKVFDGDEDTFSMYVNTYVDEFGNSYKLVPNRFMPENFIYFFNPSDFTQMVLRAPSRTELAKDGSYEQWMIEMEVGLRLRDPFCAGALKIKA